MDTDEKPLVWIGSSKKDLLALPVNVRKFFGHALDFAQRVDRHDAAKPLKGFSGAGLLEIIENAAGSTYRAVYTVKFEHAVLLPEEEQTWHCDAKTGHGHHPRSAESRRSDSEGVTRWQNGKLTISRWNSARTMCSRTSACPMPRNSK